jgi:hypothetical protein
VLEEMSAGAFCALQRFLYTNDLPKGEDCGEGLAVGEMAQVADRFQAVALYVHCVQMFTEGLKVGNAIERLVQVQDLKSMLFSSWLGLSCSTTTMPSRFCA